MILVLCVGIQMNADAQTFTQRLQQPVAGKATVTIHQSADIDQLVNSEQLTVRSSAATTEPSTAKTPTATDPTTKANVTPKTEQSNTDEVEASDMPVDNTKKIMVGYKISGYRVQAYAGGNSRKDRLEAERIGDKIKASYPEEPVYVHFYSPRWICRIGNYRTYEEAHQMLVSLRKLGFTQATIVKGKITVSN